MPNPVAWAGAGMTVLLVALPLLQVSPGCASAGVRQPLARDAAGDHAGGKACALELRINWEGKDGPLVYTWGVKEVTLAKAMKLCKTGHGLAPDLTPVLRGGDNVRVGEVNQVLRGLQDR